MVLNQTCVAEVQASRKNNISIGTSMSVLSFTLGVVMTVVAVRVKRLVWQTDKLIPLMLILMCCTLYSLCLFFILNNILDYTLFLNAVCSDPTNAVFNLIAVFSS